MQDKIFLKREYTYAQRPTRDGICIVTKEQNAQGMDSKTAKIDRWLSEIGF